VNQDFESIPENVALESGLRYDVLHLLTAIGLTPGASDTVHIYTQTTQNNTKQTIYRTTQNFGTVRAVPRLCEFYTGICLTTEEKARKNLSQGSRRVPVGTMKTEYTEQNIHNNKNT
jgi:hypothetical protein